MFRVTTPASDVEWLDKVPHSRLLSRQVASFLSLSDMATSGTNPIKIPSPGGQAGARSASLSMALYTPKKNVRNWYRYEASFSIEMMVSFVSTLEKQANESIARYTSAHAVTGHEGLDY